MKRKIFAADEKYLILLVEDDDHDNYVELQRQLNCNETFFKSNLQGYNVGTGINWKG